MDLDILRNNEDVFEENRDHIIDIVVKKNENLEKSLNENSITNFISSRLEMMNGQYSGTGYKKSLVLLSRQSPIYRHYSYKDIKANQLSFQNKFQILPEIRGQNLFGGQQERTEVVEDKIDFNITEGRLDTLHQLQNSILRYGSKSNQVWMGFNTAQYHHKLVRPGFSARRYLANLARNLNETLVKKLMFDGYILEKNLFTSNSVMPNIRRRLSDDLSRYPEPYRILKQMLMAPGVLNEFSFIWSRKDIPFEDASFFEKQEMKPGDIKILSKKGDAEGETHLEEIQYSELSDVKKKTILSNLLMKSAMNHALKMKEQMMEYNDNLVGNKTRDKISNIHLPVIKFDIKRAITELLTKETLQTLTTTEMELPYNVDNINNGFKGRNVKVYKIKNTHTPDTLIKEEIKYQHSAFDSGVSVPDRKYRDNDLLQSENITLPISKETNHNGFFGQSLKEYNARTPYQTDLETNRTSFIDTNEENMRQIYPALNHTLRLNQLHGKHKKKIIKTDSIISKDLTSVDSNLPRIHLNPLDNGLKSLHVIDREAQGIAFADMIRKRAQIEHRENLQPYGKYRDLNSIEIGDIDPKSSFSNWKYKEEKLQSTTIVTDLLTKTESSSVKTDSNLITEHNHSRLIHLLRGQADSVAEAVVGRTDGGVDFASDVNVAIRDIVSQGPMPEDQIWNLEVEDITNEGDYQGVIKNIFTSIFKEDLEIMGGGDLEVSPMLMKLLQNGYNLKLEDIEMVVDSETGKMIATLKNKVKIPKDSLQLSSLDSEYFTDVGMANIGRFSEQLISEDNSIIASSISPFNITPTWQKLSPDIQKALHGANKNSETSPLAYTSKISPQGKLTKIIENAKNDNENKDTESSGEKVEDVHVITTGDMHESLRFPKISEQSIALQSFVEENKLIEKKGLFYDNEGGFYDKEGQYHDKTGTPVISNNLILSQIEVISKLRNPDSNIPLNEEQEYDKDNNENLSLYNVEEVKMKDIQEKNMDVVSISQHQTLQDNEILTKKHLNGNVSFKENVNGIQTKETEVIGPKKNVERSSKSFKLSEKKISQKEGTNTLKSKRNQKKKEFTFGRSDEMKDVIKLYTRPDTSNIESLMSKKSTDNKKKKKHKKSDKELEKEDSADIYFQNESTDHSTLSSNNKTQELITLEAENIADLLSDKEMSFDDGDETQRLKMQKRQERVAQRKAQVQKSRLEEEMKRRKAEEERKVEEQRIALEESVNMKLEEERRRKEEEFKLLKEREREQEQEALNNEKRKEYFRLRQIEKDRQQREELARRMEEVRIRQAIEERLKKEEQEMREREEAAMLAKLNEEERNEYLRKKEELLEKQRLEEEEQERIKEENARLALEEAKLIAKQQAVENALLEERRKMKIEDDGLKKYLKVTPAFVWSYFQFLNLLGVGIESSIH